MRIVSGRANNVTAKSIKKYPNSVWYLGVVTFFLKGFVFMMLPLLIVYLDRIGYDADETGFILGLGWVLGTFVGPIVGYLSDRFSDKKVYLSIILIWSLSCFGFWQIDNYWLLCLCSLLNGFCRSTVDVLILKRMFSVVKEDQTREVSTFQSIALNSAAITGAAIGSFIAINVQSYWFLMIGLAYLLFLIIDLPMRYQEQSTTEEKMLSLRETLLILVRNRSLFWYLLSGTCFMAGYIQLESSIPILLNQENILKVLGLLQAESALLVILLSIPIIKLIKRINTNLVIFFVSILTGIGMLCFTFGVTALYFVGIALYSIGEIVYFPLWREKIVSLGGELRGTFLGFISFTDLGLFLGSSLGGYLFQNGGKLLTFGVIAIVVQFIFIFYFLGSRVGNIVDFNGVSDPKKII